MDLAYAIRHLAPYDESLLWIVIVAFVVAFVLAFGLGANDAANSFGTAVGAKVFTLLQAIILASIFELVGSIALGSNVSGTIRGGLFNSSVYDGREELLMVGQLSALGSACVWLLVATIISIPVSASHSIVGASLGFHLVVFLGTGVDWSVIVKIAISWVASPFLSGLVSCAIFFVLKCTMLDRDDQLKWGLMTVPLWYFLVFFINCLSILLHIKEVENATSIGVWLDVLVSLGLGLFVAAAVLLFLVPYTRRKAKAAEERHQREQADLKKEQAGTAKDERVEMKTDIKAARKYDDKHVPVEHAYDNKCMTVDGEVASSDSDSSSSGIDEGSRTKHADSAVSNDSAPIEVKRRRGESTLSRASSASADDEDEQSIFHVDKKSEDWLSVKDTAVVTAICGPLQGLSACFAAFSHGGNDVSNAIGPLIGLYLIYRQGEINTDEPTPIWILLYGGVGIAVGLSVLGRRVIKTIGTDLTPMTPSTGFSINLGAAITVLIASNLGIPVSTTHCLVGSVACVGFVRARKAMDVKLFTGIFSAWIVTLPVTVLLSAAFMGLLQHAVPGGCSLQPPHGPSPNATAAAMTTTA